MSKVSAIIKLTQEFSNTKPTPTSFARTVRSAKQLGFDKAETLSLLSALEFCDNKGKAFHETFKPLMEQFLKDADKSVKPHRLDNIPLSELVNQQLNRIEAKIDTLNVNSLTIAANTERKEIAISAPSYTVVNNDKPTSQKSMERLFEGLRDKRKIEAIKEVRAICGIGLKEAKDLCEQHFFNPAPDAPSRES